MPIALKDELWDDLSVFNIRLRSFRSTYFKEGKQTIENDAIMNYPTHIQDSFIRVLKPIFQSYQKPPIYFIDKIEQSIFSDLLEHCYSSLPKSLLKFFPQKVGCFLSYKNKEQERLLSILLLKKQVTFLTSSFKDHLPLYVKKIECFNPQQFLCPLDIKIPQWKNWHHRDKVFSKRLTLLLKVSSLLSHLPDKTVLFASNKDLLVSRKKDSPQYFEKKVFDLAGLRFYFSAGTWKIECFDNQLKAFLSLFRCSSHGKISAVSPWQNLPLKSIKFRYKLLKKHIKSLYSFLTTEQQEKVFKKIEYFLHLSYLSTVSKKCKISVCRVKQLS